MTLKTKAEQDIEKFYKNITYKQENGYDLTVIEKAAIMKPDMIDTIRKGLYRPTLMAYNDKRTYLLDWSGRKGDEGIENIDWESPNGGGTIFLLSDQELEKYDEKTITDFKTRFEKWLNEVKIPDKQRKGQILEQWQEDRFRAQALKYCVIDWHNLLTWQGNIGTVNGFRERENGYFLTHADIDDDAEILKKAFEKYNTMGEKTPSKGYHYTFWCKKPLPNIKDKYHLNEVFFPDDFEVENLRGTPIGKKIEIHGDEKSRYEGNYPSTTEKGDYVGFHERFYYKDIYRIPEDMDAREFVIKALEEELGCVNHYRSKEVKEFNNNPKMLTLDEQGIRNIGESFAKDILLNFETDGMIQGVHDLELDFGGYLSRHVKEEKAGKIADAVLETIENNGKQLHHQNTKTTIRVSYSRNPKERVTGLPTLMEKLRDSKKVSEEQLNHFSQVLKENIEEPYHEQEVFIDLQEAANKRKGAACGFERLITEWLVIHNYSIKANTNEPLILKDRVYEKTTHLDVVNHISENIGVRYSITENDVEKAFEFIPHRVNPSYNAIKFDNGIYDAEQGKFIENKDAILPSKVINYSPQMYEEDSIIDKYLFESLYEKDDEFTQKKIQGLKEIIGYYFIDGNPKNMMCNIIGVAGSGKSILAAILSIIFPNHCDIKPSSLNERFSLAPLLNADINIINESDNGVIKNTALFKQLISDDDIAVEAKGKDIIILDHMEKPKSILIGNNIAQFKNTEDALFDRNLYINFTVRFRGTEKENPNLIAEIKKDEEAINKFIYDCLMAWKGYDKKFILKDLFDTKTMYLKNSDPLQYIINEIFVFDEEIYIDPTTTFDEAKNIQEDGLDTEEVHDYIMDYAMKEGLNLPLNKKGQLTKKKIMPNLRAALDLEDNYTTKSRRINGKKKRFYPGLKLKA